MPQFSTQLYYIKVIGLDFWMYNYLMDIFLYLTPFLLSLPLAAAVYLFQKYIKSLLLKRRSKGIQLKIINNIRRKHRMKEFKAFYVLDSIAKGHSMDMAWRGVCDHKDFHNEAEYVRRKTGKDLVGQNCFKYPARRYNKQTALKLIKGWMNSPGHRENILNPKFSQIGIGIVIKKGYVYATQIFAG